MLKIPCALAGVTLVLLGLSACGSVGQMLTEKEREESLLRPGALDPAIPTNPYYARHTFTLLGRYRVGHDWPNLGRSCQYGGSYSGKPPGIGLKLFDSLGEIYEEDGKTYYLTDKSYATINPKTGTFWRTNLDRFVRPFYKRQIPEFDSANKKTGRMVEKEETGLTPVCFEAWVGTRHAITIMLYKRTLTEWQAALNQWSQGSYVSSDAKHFSEIVSGNRWHVYLVPLKPRMANRIAGPYELRILPIGTTDYTLAIELGANQESLQHPETHAKFKAMFRHLIESVRVEPLTPRTEVEHEALKQRALALTLQQCKQYKEPTPWCRQLLQQP